MANPVTTSNVDLAVGGEDGGLERRPELEPAAIIADPEREGGDLAVLDDSDDFDTEHVPLSRPGSCPDPRLQRAARLAALDPNDGISL